jgi:hypothetical protein
MVAAAVVYGGLLYWALTAETALAWTFFVLANVAIVVVGLVLLLRRRPPEVPTTSAVSRDDGIYRMLVIVDGEPSVKELGEHAVNAAAGRPGEALVVAPTLSSRLDWLTGDQTAYDRATADLDATLNALRAVGIEARGRVASHDPLQAAADGLREFPAEAILVVTSASDPAGAAGEDVAESLRNHTNVPVVQVA